MDSPSELTLERRFSFWVRILAATEGHLRATLVARVEWDLEGFRIILPISPCKGFQVVELGISQYPVLTSK